MSEPVSSEDVRAEERATSTRAEVMETFSAHLKELHRLSTTDYDEAGALLDDYLQTGCKMFGMDAGVISRVRGTQCVVRAAVGMHHDPPGSTYPFSGSYSGAVAQRRHTVAYEDVGQVSDLSADPVFQHIDVGAYLGTPILFGKDDELYGVLTFVAEAPGSALTQQEVEVLEMMAEGIGRFIDHELIEEERTAAMKALQSSRELLSGILGSSLEGIMAFEAVRDEAGEIVDFTWLLANPRSEELVNREVDTLVGRRLLDEMPAVMEFGLFEEFVHVVTTGESVSREIHYSEGESDTWLQSTAVQLGDGFTVTFRDITERREAEQALARTNTALKQRNRELQDFAYVASHDLQEPLRKIRAFGDLLEDDYGDRLDESGSYFLDRMRDAAKRMSQLISDLLAFSRVTTHGKPFQHVDLDSVMDDVLSDLSVRMSEVEGIVEVGTLPTIEADPIQMHQLLLNFVGNALKFHRPNVRPVVKVEAERLPASSSDQSGEQVRLLIRDNGIGFEEKYLDRIFTPFQRLHGRDRYAGTGVGLAICRRIVERHNGVIEAASTPGEGSTFTINLPVRQPPQEDASDDEAAAHNDGESL